MRILIAFSLLACTVACGGTGAAPTPAPTPVPAAAPTPPPASVAAVYVATLTASSACARMLPADLLVRTYTVTSYDDGTMKWSGPGVTEPPGHAQRSHETTSGDAFSFTLGDHQDPMSDDFHGLGEVMDGGVELDISGHGTGLVRGGRISGTFEGQFAEYLPDRETASYCAATDHQFTFEPH